jgi:multicomponent K+:H+ antiporter subunit F
MILDAVMPWVMVALALALALSAWRLLRGPSLPYRALALDTLYINALALLVVLGLWLETKAYFEAAMLIALLGFVGTVALCKFVARGDIAE